MNDEPRGTVRGPNRLRISLLEAARRVAAAWRILRFGATNDHRVRVWSPRDVWAMVARAERALELPAGWFVGLSDFERINLAVTCAEGARRDALVADIAGIVQDQLGCDWVAVEAGRWPA